ncbi:hypothetical protein [uncultured Bacteroides sp.]|uniref:hypothetical protein n=1 Tax=uncultured Bacteroides sp. TaxID=162156 RepID=UPI0025FF3A01|nr:hypothetical protein [uncultured Bacteroides sp.]
MSPWHSTARTPSGIANYGMKRYITPVLPQKGGQRTGRATIIELILNFKKNRRNYSGITFPDNQ